MVARDSIALLLTIAGVSCGAGTARTAVAPTATSSMGATPTASVDLSCPCFPPGASPSPSPPQATATPSTSTSPVLFWVRDITNVDEKQADTNISVTVVQARFGELEVETDPAARCIAIGNYASGALIQTGGLGLRVADESGAAKWSYDGAPLESGVASYTFTCSKDSNLRSTQAFFAIP